MQAFTNNKVKGHFRFFLLADFVKELGYNSAAFLGYLINKYYFYLSEGTLTSHKKHGEGWIYLTIHKAEEEIHLSRDEQDVCIKTFKKLGLLEHSRFGDRASRHFRLNFPNIAKILTPTEVIAENPQSPLRKTHNLDCGDATIPSLYNNITTRNINNTHTQPSLKTDGVGVCDATDVACVSDFSSPQEDSRNITSKSGRCQSDSTSAKPPKKSKPKPEDLPCRAENVHVSDDDHKKLCDEFGEEDTQGAYLHLSDWKQSAKKSTVEKHSNDYIRIKNWAMLAYLERKSKMQKLRPANTQTVSAESVLNYLKTNWDPKKGIRVDVLPDKVEIVGGGAKNWCDILKYTENGFFPQLENILRNRHFNKRI